MVRPLKALCFVIVLIAVSRGDAVGTEDKRLASFEEAWRLVQTEFFDPTLRGLDWDAVREKYRPLAATAGTAKERSAVINRMLAELGASHTGHFTPDDIAYYDLFDIFSGSLRKARERLFPGGRVAYDGIGAIVRTIGGRTFVTGIMDGFPAARAGLRTGDQLVTADGAPYHPIRSFRGRVGLPVVLEIRRTSSAELETVVVTPEEIRPGEAYLEAMRKSVRIIEKKGARIGYIRIWSYAGRRYQELLEHELSMGRLADADALVWDLRDGWGGAQLSYLDVFDQSGPTMTVIDRDGERDLVGFRWRKPVAMLVNGGTRSGKEILAHGLKTQSHGEVIGTRTAGAVLAGRAFILSDDSLLLLAVADVLVDGERLEGQGVTPTIEVPVRLEYLAGKDPQLDRALEVLARSIRS